MKASKPNSLPGEKVVSEKDMRLEMKAPFLQNFLNVKTKEWGNIVIKVASTLKKERQTVMHVIKGVMNNRDGKAQEGMKELDTSWERLTFSN